jgi:hypothetical protein
MYLKGFSYPSLRYCLVDGGFYSIKQEEGYEFEGIYENNIDSDPMFLKEGDEYYSLQNSSQCIDMGCPDTTFMDLPPTDLIGCDRIFDGNDNGISRIDIGAYEFGSPFIGIQEYGEANENGLIQNFPNPFYDFTTISFSLMEDSEVLIIIYDRSGRKLDELVNDKMHRGDYIFEWNSDKIQPGIYFCVLKTELKTQTIKLCKMN